MPAWCFCSGWWRGAWGRCHERQRAPAPGRRWAWGARGARRPRRAGCAVVGRGERRAGGACVGGAWVGWCWGASSAGWVSRVFLPTPQSVFASLLEGLDLSRDAGNGELIAFTQATVGHMLQGWLLASLFGVLPGTAIGVSRVARAWVQPTLEFIRPLPASALLPLALSIFGLNRGTVLSVVAFGAMWPVLLATVHGLATLEPRLSEVARCLQMSRGAQVWKMGLPNAMPDILAGMRLALTVALIVAVVG